MGELTVHQTYRVHAVSNKFSELMPPEVDGLKTPCGNNGHFRILKELPETHKLSLIEKVIESVSEIQLRKHDSPVVIHKKPK
jgi:hypothetical protein